MNDELADATWFKSSRSGPSENCVEVAFLTSGKVGVRDSKNRTGPALIFTPGAWNAFVGGARTGEFHRP